ncbi:hypothetical protein [Macrococcus capreoli]|nr:hypothetical protein [Macrococcus sp. TMW 2.2395]MCU7557248.1 hypothetical protein [Macrococcus sp. TMW 2.2395]
MLALLIANRILEGKYTFSRCPESLKPQVKQLLVDWDVPELAM